MTRYFLRLPSLPTIDEALAHERHLGLAVLEPGNDGLVRGSVEVAPMSDRARAVKAVCDFYRVHVRRLLDGGKTAHLADARAVCMWLLRCHVRLCWQETAEAVGLENHTSAIAAVQKVDRREDLIAAAKGIAAWLDGQRGEGRAA